jgi:SAM-dependent methyltransferase
MGISPAHDALPLERIWALRYGHTPEVGWGPTLRRRFGYSTPDEIYEAVVLELASTRAAWVDIGCGKTPFPGNPALAGLLSKRAPLLVGLDQDSTIEQNPYVHRRVKSSLEAYTPGETFDLVTMRMVAEHIVNPRSAVEALARLTRSGSKLVIYTVNRRSPAERVAAIVPFRFHHRIKHWIWRTMEEDTFPVSYQMNTRRELRGWLEPAGFRERSFAYLDDCRASARFRWAHRAELTLWRILRRIGLRYPENCLLGVYERV